MVYGLGFGALRVPGLGSNQAKTKDVRGGGLSAPKKRLNRRLRLYWTRAHNYRELCSYQVTELLALLALVFGVCAGLMSNAHDFQV